MNLLDEFKEAVGENKKDVEINKKGEISINLDSAVMYKPHKLDYIFKFGKYKGAKLKEVVLSDPDYVNFLINSTKFSFKVHDEVMDLLKEQ
jgi:hypothetical protein